MEMYIVVFKYSGPSPLLPLCIYGIYRCSYESSPGGVHGVKEYGIIIGCLF